MTTLSKIEDLGQQLTLFLAMHAEFFCSLAGRRLLRVYVKDKLSDIQRKNCKSIVLKFGEPLKTLHRLLESIK